jgi:hypothetical protein
MANKILMLAVISVASIGVSSCSEDIPDCPTRMCVVAGGWQLTEVHVDNVKDNSDLSQFTLTLNMPSSATATTSGFARIQVSGNSDSGIWSLENNETILRLMPDNDPLLTEDWIIKSMTPRKMVLIINRDTSIKQGPGKIEFILEPF